jgi:hypothetical protein
MHMLLPITQNIPILALLAFLLALLAPRGADAVPVFCNVSIEFTDSYGDGNSGTGSVGDSYVFAPGSGWASASVGPFAIVDPAPFSVIFASDSFPDETSLTVAVNGTVLERCRDVQLLQQSSVAMGPDEMLYAGSWDSKIHAIDPATGTALWTYQTGGQIETAPAVGPDGTVYVGSRDKRLHAVDASTGQGKWTFWRATRSIPRPPSGPTEPSTLAPRTASFTVSVAARPLPSCLTCRSRASCAPRTRISPSSPPP